MAQGSRKAIFAALVGNFLIAISKFTGAFFSKSSAMLSEGIHSTVDVGNQILLLYGLKRAEQKPNEQFPFGHGKEIYFWSFVVAILIFALGAGFSLYEGIHHIRNPEPLQNMKVNYLILSLSIVFEAAASFLAFKEFSKRKGQYNFFSALSRSKDPSLFVVLFEDGAALIGLFVALIGIAVSQLTGNPVYDGIASVIIGLILASTALWLAWETKSLLIGESAHPETVAAIKKMIESHEAVRGVNEVLTMHLGPSDILVNISVKFFAELPVGDLESIIEFIDQKLKTQFPQVKRVFIEAEKV